MAYSPRRRRCGRVLVSVIVLTIILLRTPTSVSGAT
ncbi:hypothetical protein MIPYR_20521 [uncultured Microbacterium sp.]|uniref:Uncharacterized protein n=1 Tax=uncultured Microbacterium sp. TaxID=191216 RepID=A0A1Y5P0V3_9MICO|nr:hypothetical protein MIPYR_20521 [uncultured Microbacterium sp.]